MCLHWTIKVEVKAECPSVQWLLVGIMSLLMKRWARMVTNGNTQTKPQHSPTCGCCKPWGEESLQRRVCAYLSSSNPEQAVSHRCCHIHHQLCFHLKDLRVARAFPVAMQIFLVISVCCGVMKGVSLGLFSPKQSPGLGVTSVRLLSKAAYVRCATSQIERQAAWTWSSCL